MKGGGGAVFVSVGRHSITESVKAFGPMVNSRRAEGHRRKTCSTLDMVSGSHVAKHLSNVELKQCTGNQKQGVATKCFLLQFLFRSIY